MVSAVPLSTAPCSLNDTSYFLLYFLHSTILRTFYYASYCLLHSLPLPIAGCPTPFPAVLSDPRITVSSNKHRLPHFQPYPLLKPWSHKTLSTIAASADDALAKPPTTQCLDVDSHVSLLSHVFSTILSSSHLQHVVKKSYPPPPNERLKSSLQHHSNLRCCC